MKMLSVARSLLVATLLLLLANSAGWAVSFAAGGNTCEDNYENDDRMSQAHEITGPETHTIYKPFSSTEEDWVKFKAQPMFVYQITALGGVFPTDPVLQLYNDRGTLLATNDHYFGKNAEIWWWNNGPEQTLYVKTTEFRALSGCEFYYTIELIPWDSEAFQLRFGNQ